MNLGKLKSALIWTTILVGIGTLLFLSVQRKGKADVESLVIHIKANENGRLIQEKDVRKLVVLTLGFDPKNKSIRSINSRKLEAELESDPRVKNAEVYFDGKDRLHVELEPKKVIVRISDVSGDQYFLDENGNKVPIIRGGAVRVPLANGYIEKYAVGFDQKPGKSPLKEIFRIVKFTREDDFLNALIEQIHVDETGEIILIPKVGKEKLVFGGSEQMEEKFENLKIFYRDGMTKLGWNRYPSLNLKFVNQVVLVDGKPSAHNPATETAMRLE
jgi:cell division protein FtsQ